MRIPAGSSPLVPPGSGAEPNREPLLVEVLEDLLGRPEALEPVVLAAIGGPSVPRRAPLMGAPGEGVHVRGMHRDVERRAEAGELLALLVARLSDELGPRRPQHGTPRRRTAPAEVGGGAGARGASATGPVGAPGPAPVRPADPVGAGSGSVGAGSGSVGAGSDPVGAGSGSVGAGSGSVGASHGGAAPPARLAALPPRPADALTGAQVRERLAALPPGAERERFVHDQIASGNVPESSRELQPVTVQRMGSDGRTHDLTMHVMPDYLAIGSDRDNVRVPMTPGTAHALADRLGATLPTTRMADAIHAAAGQQLHLDPIPWKPGAAHGRYMLSGAAAAEHDARIDRQLVSPPGTLVSGHKKDLVIPAADGKVAIYGARFADGRTVQPYSNVHEASYADYSHGVRLVSRTVLVDGRPLDLRDVLADPVLSPLVSDRLLARSRE